ASLCCSFVLSFFLPPSLLLYLHSFPTRRSSDLLIASFIGFLIENAVRKHSKKPDDNWFLSKLFRPRATRITVEDQEAEEKQVLEEKKEQAKERSTNSQSPESSQHD